MCDMPADRIKNTLVLCLWPASEETATERVLGMVEFAGVDTLLRAYQKQYFPLLPLFLTTSHQARLPA